MRSELYKVIYQVAIFCMIATLGLSIGGIVVCNMTAGSVAVGSSAYIISRLIVGLGVVLFIASIVVTIVFYQKYKKQFVADRELRMAELDDEEQLSNDVE